MKNLSNAQRIILAIIIPLILLVISLAIMDDMSSWNDFKNVWLVWVVLLIVVLWLELRLFSNNNTGLVSLSKSDVKKYIKRIFWISIILLFVFSVLFVGGYIYNNQKIPIEHFDCSEAQLRGYWDKGLATKFSVRITNNSESIPKEIISKIIIYDKEDNTVIDEKIIEFYDWDSKYLYPGSTKLFSVENEYGIISDIPQNFTWSYKLISAKQRTFIDDIQ